MNPRYEKLVEHCLDMLDIYDKRIELAKQLVRGHECQRDLLIDFIYACTKNDIAEVLRLGELVGKESAPTRRVYEDAWGSSKKVNATVNKLREERRAKRGGDDAVDKTDR